MPSILKPVKNDYNSKTNEKSNSHTNFQLQFSEENMRIPVNGELSSEYVMNYLQLQEFKSTEFGKSVIESFKMTEEEFIIKMIRKRTTVKAFLDKITAIYDISKYYSINSKIITDFMRRNHIDVTIFWNDLETLIDLGDELEIEFESLPDCLPYTEFEKLNLKHEIDFIMTVHRCLMHMK